ncbi:MAG TPA: flagellar biosynthetic protein FliO [Gammaproteobacteria bacterium]|nr:flagellar biosynthetic protein FliO [Gammaproteobacteria bacterium]
MMRRAAIVTAGLIGFSATDAALAAPGVQVGDLSTVVLSLALVVGFIFAAAFVAKRMPFGLNARGNGPLKVVAALSLGPKERLLLVEARGEQLLIAVSPAGVFNLGAGAHAVPAAPVFQLGDAQ